MVSNAVEQSYDQRYQMQWNNQEIKIPTETLIYYTVKFKHLRQITFYK